ncbi:25S rRNA adenine-N(1) methyltransferase-like [Teratosphaeria destructans]|uniref:25S rRNA adenine-N(1) methyltransferase n=1 Tax=Teratosphaeria destructans TaxID=418781 RepID=A0A9W7W5Z7_9PEZI|nr:25S rRNA adenine-N(1) methyltransferase-like [Teratosphaeria destructans]
MAETSDNANKRTGVRAGQSNGMKNAASAHLVKKAAAANGIQKATTKGIKAGRPPLAKRPPAQVSKHVTHTKIRQFHQSQKELAKAEAKGDEVKAEELRKRLEDLGGLQAYQEASILGQSVDRGGDSSIVLMEWLKPDAAVMKDQEPKLTLLEVGALSTKNACSKSGLFEIERIDLFSQADGIIQQDFMERPLPTHDHEQFDIISLSLVLNFVPDAEGRGEMLRRTTQFLDRRAPREMPDTLQKTYPALFLVLPAACILNSRYMDEERLTLIMASLGYVQLQRKLSAKLVYYLWQLRDQSVPEEQKFTKSLVNPGGGRNNFSVVLKG